MAINDKVLAAFLVSMGLFSVAQAQQYVDTLSSGEKIELLSVTNVSDDTTPVESPQIAGGQYGNN